MGVPVVYRKSGEPILANYSFYDLSTGTGYKTFYGTQVIEATTTKYSLIPEELDPNAPQTTSSSNGALDLDFDLIVNVPLKIEGNTIVSVPIGASIGGATPAVTTVTIKLYSLDKDGNETQIGSTVSTTKSFNAGSSSQIVSGRIVTPFTIIHKEGGLRVSVTTSATGVNNYHLIYHSPTNSGSSTDAPVTRLNVNIPIKLDL